LLKFCGNEEIEIVLELMISELQLFNPEFSYSWDCKSSLRTEGGGVMTRHEGGNTYAMLSGIVGHEAAALRA
jgi:hypothetical protein